MCRAVLPRPWQSWHDASVSKRGSRYFRAKPQCVDLTFQPCCRAAVSKAANNGCVSMVRLDLI